MASLGLGNSLYPGLGDWVGNHQSALLGLASGLAAGPNLAEGISKGFAGAQQGQQYQNAYALQLADQKQRQDQIAYERTLQQNALQLQSDQRKAAANWAIQNGHPEWAGALMSGAITGGDAFNQYTKQTVVPFGSTVINGQGQTVAGGDPSSGFGGTDLKSQAYNTLLQGQKDPSLRNTPKYRAAYAIATEPTMTPQGMMQPNIPASWAPDAAPPAQTPPTVPQPPTGGAGSYGSDTAPIGSMATAPQSGFPSVAGPSNQTLGPGVIPGTQPFNESQARTTMLTQSAIPDLKRVISGFPALINTKDQVLQHFGSVGRLLQDPAYKQAHDAMTSAIGNVLYVASGANLNAGELQRKVEAYTPAIGDDGPTAANKLDRFANDIVALANNTKDPQTIAWAQQALQGLQATRDQILGGSQTAKAPVTKTVNGVTYTQGADGGWNY